MTSIVSVSSIAVFFGDEAQLIEKGENSLSSSRLEKFSYSPETHHILAKVRASMKDKSYSVEVSNHTYTDVTLLDFCFLPFCACSVAFQVEVMIS